MLAMLTLATYSSELREKRWRQSQALDPGQCSSRELISRNLLVGWLVDDVKTTPQKTRFRDVKYVRIWDTD